MKRGLIFLSVLLLIFSYFGFLNGVYSFFQKGFLGIEGFSYRIFQGLPIVSESARVKKLEQENLDLRSQISAIDRLKKENQALLDQFQTQELKTAFLLPTRILGAPGFVPGISLPLYFVVDKGSDNKVKIGQAVVFKNQLIGQVATLTSTNAKINLIYNPTFSFTAKTQKGASGVIRGDGRDMILDNVLLSDSIEVGDLVHTKGDANLESGILPDLMVGKIVSLEKDPSALFQKAKVKALLNFNNLSDVFIIIGEK